MPKLINTFINGMDKDTSVDKFQNTKYFNLENGRIVTSEELTTSAITNIKGNKVLLNSSDSDISITGTLVGWCSLQEDYILFTKDTTEGYIYRLTPSDLVTSTGEVKFNFVGASGFDFLYTGTLNFGDKIKAISRYENENVQKVWWTDEVNMLRSINLADPNVISIPESKLDIVSDIISMPTPTFNSFTSGNLYSGKVQIAYRYYNLNGIETVFSPLSPLIPLTTSSETKTTNEYIGTEKNVNTNKGVIFTITDLDVNYDRIEIVALHYNDRNTTPNISIVSRSKFGNTLNVLVDGTNYIGTLTLDEFNILKNPIYAGTMTIKDNRLFLGNIKESIYWNQELEDWDARSYRYNSLGNTYADGVDDINPYNDINNDFDPNYRYIYLSDGTTLGSSGTNIDIKLVKYSYKIAENINLFYSDTTWLNTTIDNANKEWIFGSKCIFQGNETYRFGIRLFNSKMQASFVKWICDFRFPGMWSYHLDTGDYYNTITKDTDFPYASYANAIIPQFIMKGTLPSDCKYWQIVYVKREEWDKTILSQGILSGSYSATLGASTIQVPYPTITTYAGSEGETQPPYNGNISGLIDITKYSDKGLNEFTSPEVVFNTISDYSNVIIEIEGYCDNIASAGSTVEGRAWITKAQDTVGIKKDQYSRMSNLSGKRAITLEEGVVGVTEIKFKNDTNCAGVSDWRGDRGTNVWLAGCDASGIRDAATTGGYDDKIGIFNMMRKTSQYGGNTENDRLNNTYIPAGDLIPSTTHTCECYYGDTYITYFECQRVIYHVDAYNSDDYRSAETVLIPIQSQFNLFYRNDSPLTKLTTDYKYLIREEPFVSSITGDEFYGLYKYNNVYSKICEIPISIPAPSEIVIPNSGNYITNSPVRIKYSNFKYDGEEVDSWMKYPTNQFAECIGNYGEITHLKELNNQIYCFQKYGINVPSINRQETQTLSSGVATVLGTGGILTRFDYITTEIGVDSNSDIVKSLSSLYFIDINKKKHYRLSDKGIETLSDLKYMSSLFRNSIDTNSSCIGIYDNNNSSVLMTIYNTYNNTIGVTATSPANRLLIGGTTGLVGQDNIRDTSFRIGQILELRNSKYQITDCTLTYIDVTPLDGASALSDNYDISSYITYPNTFTFSYNELIDNYESLHKFYPNIYLKNNSTLLTYINSQSTLLWQHNIGNYGQYYNSSTYVPVILEIILNDGGQDIKEFNNIEWYSEVRSLNKDYELETINRIQVENDYQQSEDILLYPLRYDDYIMYNEGTNIPIGALNPALWTSGTPYTKGALVSGGLSGLNINNTASGVFLCLSGNTGQFPTGLSNDKFWQKYNLANLRRNIRSWNTGIPRVLAVPADDYITSDSSYGSNKYNRTRDYYLKVKLRYDNNSKRYVLYDIRSTFENV